MNETLRILKDARDRIARGWCVYSRGLDQYGNYREGYMQDAVKWCALGAIDGALGSNCDGQDIVKVLARAVPLELHAPDQLPETTVASYNNNSDQAGVLSLFDRAIATLQPARRPTSAMLADLMARVNGERIPEDVT